MTSYLGVATDTPRFEGVRFAGNVPGGSVARSFYHTTATLSPAAVAANTTAEQTFTVPGVAVGDVIYINKPTSQVGLALGGVRVSAANQIGITFVNATAASITPTASQVYQVGGIR